MSDDPRADLEEQVAARENDRTVERLERAQRKTVYNALYQTHLPKLANYGAVTYNRRSGRIRLDDRAEECLAYLRLRPIATTGTILDVLSRVRRFIAQVSKDV